MADQTYVNIAQVVVKEAFDNKYKSKLCAFISEGLADAVDHSSKLTTKAPKDKNEQGFYLAGEARLTRTDKGVAASASIVLADWPSKKMFGNKASKADIDVPSPARLDQKVDEVLSVVLQHLQVNVIKELEKRAK
jgi:hypothetical protein